MTELLLDRLFSFNNIFILEKNLLSVAPPNPHRMQFSISKIEEGDWEEVLKQVHCLDIESKREIFARLFFRNHFRNCYGVRSKTGAIAHIQWIVFPEENEAIVSHYRHFFRPLERYEVMIENAFTFPRFRGLGLFAYATRRLLYLSREQEYKKATTYVRCEKIASLNETIRLGFSIKKVIREYKFLGFTRRALEERRSGRSDRGAAGQLNNFPAINSAGKSNPGIPVEGERQHGFR